MNLRKDIYYYIGLLVIIIGSFLFYSPRFYPLLSSDDALNVLMTYYYKLPQDIYCWGQDRGGTLIPLLSQIPHKLFGISPINAVSIVNYAILILGYIGFSSLFKNRFTKLIFAVVWFFPPLRFIDLIRFPLGIEYSLIGFSIFLINKVDLKKNSIHNHVLCCLVILLLSISLWVSDLTIVSVVLMGVTGLFFYYRNGRKMDFRKSFLLYLPIVIAANYFFLKFAKGVADAEIEVYVSFSDWNTIVEGIRIVTKEWYRIFTFQSNETVYSLYVWLIVLFFILTISLVRKGSLRLSEKNLRWFTFFILDFCAVFGVLFLSKWVFLNGMGRWYFVPVYISFSVATLILFDNLKLEYHKLLSLKSLLLVVVLLGAGSTIHHLKNVYPKTLRSKIDIRAEFLTLGEEVGIIGEFWNSYISATPDPKRIKATSHDKSNVRSQFLVDEVFKQPNLYVIRDMWMDSFPDTLEQFGYILLRDGESFMLGDSYLNRYSIVKRNQVIPFRDFHYASAVQSSDVRIEMYRDSVSLKNSCVVWGPHMTVGIGNFVLTYQMKGNCVEIDQPFAYIDVAADYGKTLLAGKKLTMAELYSNEEGSITLEFSTDKRYANIEFRFFYYGICDVIIDQIHLMER